MFLRNKVIKGKNATRVMVLSHHSYLFGLQTNKNDTKNEKKQQNIWRIKIKHVPLHRI